MRRTALIMILIAVAAAGVFGVLHFQKAAKHAAVPVSGPVLLTVFGFTTNSDLEPEKEYYSARILMTNASTSSVFFSGESTQPIWDTRVYEPEGWASWGGPWICFPAEVELKAGQSITFEAFIFEGDKPCQVTLNYWDDKGTRHYSHIAATEVIQFPSTRP